MEIAAEKLEALVLQAETILDTVALELEIKSSKETGAQFSPVRFIRSSQEMLQELDDLKQEAEMLVKNQEEVKHKLEQELSEVCKKLENIENKIGSSCDDASTTGSVLKSRFKNIVV